MKKNIYDSHCEQNQRPDCGVERLKDAERVWNADAADVMRSTHDNAKSEVLERTDEVDNLLTS